MSHFDTILGMALAGEGGGGGGSDYVILTEDDGVLNMTWQGISDALTSGKTVIIDRGYLPRKVSKVTSDDYGVWIYYDGTVEENEDYFAESADDYPVYD